MSGETAMSGEMLWSKVIDVMRHGEMKFHEELARQESYWSTLIKHKSELDKIRADLATKASGMDAREKREMIEKEREMFHQEVDMLMIINKIHKEKEMEKKEFLQGAVQKTVAEHLTQYRITQADIEPELEKVVVKKLEAWIGGREEEEWLEKDIEGAHKYLQRAAKARDIVSQLPGMCASLKLEVRSWEALSGRALYYNGIPVSDAELNDPRMFELLRKEKNKRQLISKRNEAVEALEALKKCEKLSNLSLLLQIGDQDALQVQELSRLSLASGTDVDAKQELPRLEAIARQKIELMDARRSDISELSTLKAFHQAVARLSYTLDDVISEVDQYSDYGSSVIVPYTTPAADDSKFASDADISFLYNAFEQASASLQELVEGELDKTLKLKAVQQASSAADELLEIADRLLSLEVVERYMQLVHKHLTAAANAVWMIDRLLSFGSYERDKFPPMGIARLLFLKLLDSFLGNCEFGALSWNREDMSIVSGAAGALAAAQSELANLGSQVYETCGRKFKTVRIGYLTTDKKEELDSRVAVGLRELELHLERVVSKVKNLE